MLIIEQMWSRLATTGLMVTASLNVHAIVSMLALPVRGAHHAGFLHTSGKVVSCRTRATSSISEFVIRPVGFNADEILLNICWPF